MQTLRLVISVTPHVPQACSTPPQMLRGPKRWRDNVALQSGTPAAGAHVPVPVAGRVDLVWNGAWLQKPRNPSMVATDRSPNPASSRSAWCGTRRFNGAASDRIAESKLDIAVPQATTDWLQWGRVPALVMSSDVSQELSALWVRWLGGPPQGGYRPRLASRTKYRAMAIPGLPRPRMIDVDYSCRQK